MNTSITLKIGARGSALSVRQTTRALDQLRLLLPQVQLDLITYSSPGDEDRQTDLRISDPDFFTRYLDRDVLNGTLDAAVHSAKDMPDPLPEGMDWCWLPWPEDRRDACIYRPGESAADLPEAPVIGVSSDRREEYCRSRWPNAIHKPIRGNIEHRLEQLDKGDYDVVLMAGCALVRLGLEERISEWIPLEELDTPLGQGYLGMTFRADDTGMIRLRNLLIQSVALVSAGPGDPGLCTVAGLEAIRSADVCLYDALAPHELLAELPRTAKAIYVGKRSMHYQVGREEMERMIVDHCREGKRVVRLKGGDAGIFARLAQEAAALQAAHLPFRVIPGISSMQAATTPTGLMLTRKGVSRGFCVVTPETLYQDGAGVGMEDRQGLPLVLYMATHRVRDVVADLLKEGRPHDEPAAVIFGASTPYEVFLTGTLSDIAEQVEAYDGSQPGLLLVGKTADARYRFASEHFPLEGKRILLTCSQRVMPAAVQAVHDLGGKPVPMPLIRLVAAREAMPAIGEVGSFDWVVLTSPSAVDCFLQLLREGGGDLRAIPRLLVCGPGTAAALSEHGLQADAAPTESFSAEAMLETARRCIQTGERVLRLRSSDAGTAVADALREHGAVVVDEMLYRNERVPCDRLPPFDAVFFASSSAVDAFVDLWGSAPLVETLSVAIGEPTSQRLQHHGVHPTTVPAAATARDAIQALAGWLTTRSLRP